jgi:uncharacterized repeat protein (TIGR04138 family)
MSLDDELSRVLARDPRYTIEAYAFVLEALENAKTRKRRVRARTARARGRSRRDPFAHHVSGQELCEGVRQLALNCYGRMARVVLGHWGLHATGDLGNVVYNLIAAGIFDKTPTDSRTDFDDVFDFDQAFVHEFALSADDLP